MIFELMALVSIAVGVGSLMSSEKKEDKDIVKGKTFENMDIFIDGKKTYKNSVFKNVNFKL